MKQWINMTFRRRLARLWYALLEPDVWGDCRHHAPDAPEDCSTADCHLDPGIYELVWGLWEAGVVTGSSCQGVCTGGSSHARMLPMITVGYNDEAAGPRARDVALALGMPLLWLHRVETVDKRLTSVSGPCFWWELVFDPWMPAWTRP
jgi:hypothetical protein